MATAKAATAKATEELSQSDQHVAFITESNGSCAKVVVGKILGILSESPSSFKIQRAGVTALTGICKDRDMARFVNSQNGQQILLFNVFRDLLEDEVTQSPISKLRHLLSNSRLNAISSAIDELVRHPNL